MKKLFTTATLMLALCVCVYAQDTKKGLKFGVGLEGALPTGMTGYSFGAGLTLRAQYALDDKMAITGTSGFIAFLPDKATMGANAKAQINIPIKAGFKYMLTGNVYGILESGYTISKFFVVNPATGNVMSLSGSSFTYAPGVGAKLGFLDASVRYEGYSGGGFVGLRLAAGI